MKLKAALALVFLPVFQLVSQTAYKLGIPYGHNELKPIQCLSFSANGNKLLSASQDATASLWEISTGRLLFRMKCPGEPINAAVFSHDGSKIITLSHAEIKYPFVNRVRIWNASNGELIDTFPAEEESMTLLAISPNDKHLVLGGSADSSLQLWDIESKKIIGKSSANKIMISSCEYSTSGEFIYSAGWDNEAFILDAQDLHVIHKFSGHKTRITCSTADKSGKYFLTASADGVLNMWNVKSGELIKSFSTHNQSINCVSFDSAGNYFTCADASGKCSIYEVAGTKLKYELKLPGILITQLSFYDNNSKLLASTLGDSVYIISILSGKVIGSFAGGCSVAARVFAFSENTQRIAAASNFGRIYISDLRTHQLLYTISDHAPGISQLWLDKTRQHIVNESYANSVGFWNGRTGETFAWYNDMMFDGKGLFALDNTIYLGSFTHGINQFSSRGKPTGKRFKSSNRFLSTLDFLSSGQKLITASWDSSVRIYSIENTKLLHSIYHNNRVLGAIPSPLGNEFATFGDDSILQFFSDSDYTIKAKFHLDGRGTAGLYSPDGKYYVQVVENSRIFLLDAYKKEIIDSFFDDETDLFLYIHSMVFSPDSKYLFTGLNEGPIIKFSIPGLNIIQELNNHKNRVYHLTIHPKSNLLLSAGGDVYVSCWDYKNGTLMGELRGHTGEITGAEFLRDSSIVLTSSMDGTMKFWDLKTGTEKLTAIPMDSSYVLLRPDGYFKAPGSAVKKLYYTDGEKTVGFEQLDLRNNRPDLIMETLGDIYQSTDTAAIKGYKSAYLKRLKKLGIDPEKFTTMQFNAPECSIKNATQIPLNSYENTLRLSVEGKSQKGALKILNCWVNDVPVFGATGLKLISELNKIDTFFTIDLSEGMNKIEVSVMDETGTESYRNPVYTVYKSKVPLAQKVFFIGIGANKYSDSSHNLYQSVKDIRDLVSALRNRYKGNLEVDTLFDENVSLANLRKLKKKLLQTSVNDKVIVSFSGHGLLDSKLDYYLGAWGVDFKNPAIGGIPYDSMEWLLDNIPSRKKLFLLDACHSGELDKADIVAIQCEDSLSSKNDSVRLVQRGGSNLRLGKSKTGLQNSFLLMQEAFVQVGRGTGTNIISAASGTQFALESSSLSNGIFTWCVLSELEKTPSISVQQLRKNITSRVLLLSNGLQKPTSRAENLSVDWEL